MSLVNSDVFSVIRYYRQLLESDIDLFSLSLDELKEYFSEDLETNGIILSLLTKILKRKVEILESMLVKQDNKQEIKRIFKEVLKEETGLDELTIEELLMIDSFRDKLRKPKSIKPQRISYKEFQELTKQEVLNAVSHSVDYNELARDIYERIKKGVFRIKTYRDFIGLMYAIYLFDFDLGLVDGILPKIYTTNRL